MATELFEVLTQFYRDVIKPDFDDIREKMATKADLDTVRGEIATKSDLHTVRDEMATKADFQALRVDVDALRGEMATKSDLQAVERGVQAELQAVRGEMATKSELQAMRGEMATKSELQGVEREMNAMRREMITWPVLIRFHETVIRLDTDEVRSKLDDLATRDALLTHVDGIYGRFDRLETEYYALLAAVRRLETQMQQQNANMDVLRAEMFEVRKQIQDLTQRVANLENVLN